MAPSDDPFTHASTLTTDLYALLSLAPTASASEIKRAYRQSALKSHPDKLPASLSAAEREAALENFHQLGIAQDVLLDDTAREVYDNARRARVEKEERRQAFEGRRKGMVESLERREWEGGNGKRKRDSEEEEFERQVRRLAEDGARRRREREELMKREAESIQRQEDVVLPPAPQQQQPVNGNNTAQHQPIPQEDLDTRFLTLRFPSNPSTTHIDTDYIRTLFSVRFGPLEDVILHSKPKKVKLPGQKHRQEFKTALLVFANADAASAAANAFEGLVRVEPETWGEFESLTRAMERKGDGLPVTDNAAVPETKATPAFSFLKNGSNPPASVSVGGELGVEERMQARLKLAEKRRVEAKLRQQREAGEAGGGDMADVK